METMRFYILKKELTFQLICTFYLENYGVKSLEVFIAKEWDSERDIS